MKPLLAQQTKPFLEMLLFLCNHFHLCHARDILATSLHIFCCLHSFLTFIRKDSVSNYLTYLLHEGVPWLCTMVIVPLFWFPSACVHWYSSIIIIIFLTNTSVHVSLPRRSRNLSCFFCILRKPTLKLCR